MIMKFKLNLIEPLQIEKKYLMIIVISVDSDQPACASAQSDLSMLVATYCLGHNIDLYCVRGIVDSRRAVVSFKRKIVHNTG